MAPPRGGGRRIPWQRVPGRVRGTVEAMLGAQVVEARTQDGGFSPGCAARLRLSNGGTAFVKALGIDIHPFSVELYRTEAATMPRLPPGLPVPRLLDAHDDGEWVALVYEEIDGRHPAIPWQTDDLERVAAALDDLGTALCPSPWPDAQPFAEPNSDLLATWRRLASDPPPDLDPWLRRHLDRMAAQHPSVEDLVQGDTMLHTDLRSDNLLLTPDGGVVVVDWGWTCNGAPWLDVVLFALAVNAEGGADPDLLIRRHPLTRDIAPTWVDAVLTAVGSNYWWMSRPPGASTFHRAYADATLDWVRRRIAH